MRRLNSSLVSVAAALRVLGAVARADEDEKVPLDKGPAKVKETAKAKYPKAQFVSAEKGDQDGTKVYELVLKQGDKKWEVEVQFDPDGRFLAEKKLKPKKK